ncbi:MAG: type III-A CRISPR-associated protein Csm2, partial [Geminicoccaceae bacterium]|nr:type III-A CRISPR-associated protein Csm2 [Geminicoccaceae bacterium]
RGPHQHGPRPGAPSPGQRPPGPGGGHGGGGGGSYGGGGHGGGNDGEVAALLKPPAEKETYFVETSKKNEQGETVTTKTIRVALLDEEAQKMAEKLKELPNTQLRRFYDPVVALRLRAQAGKLVAEQVKAELALMKARAAYAYRRPGQKVPAELVKFFTKHAASVDSPEKLVAFARHFEAIVAYHRVYNPN